MAEQVTIEGQGITLDLLLWRRFGIAGQALLEATYELNRGIAALGAVLPAGTVVTLPDPPSPRSAAATVTVVDLFG